MIVVVLIRHFFCLPALANLKEMLTHKDSRTFSTVTQSAAGFLSTDDGKFKYLKVRTHILKLLKHMNYVLYSEMEPALKRDISKGVRQTDGVMATKRSECVESSGQLSSCPTSSRNDNAGPTGVQDVERTGLSVSTHLPQCKK